jgi:hypothetical protein
MRRLALTVAAAVVVSLPATLSGAAPLRSFATGHFAIEIEGKHAGYVDSVEGGAVLADVVEETGGSSYFVKKHIGNVKYEDFTIRVGMPPGQGLGDWMESIFQSPAQRHDGAIVAADFNFAARTRHEFQDALITEIGFPALDGASKDPAYFTVKISPESTAVLAGDGSVLPAVQKQKLWSASSFRFNLGGLPTSRVSKIDAFTIKQKVSPEAPGEERDPRQQTTTLQIPTLKVTVSLADLPPWADWAESFIVGGANSDGDELNGSIEYLDASLRQVLGTVDLKQVGIVSLRRLVPGAGTIGLFEVELYVEEMHLDFAR